jgi:hypothetical protein
MTFLRFASGMDEETKRPLVLVDLSETVMAFSVTKHLDILEALALLCKPDGTFVKNELYMDKLSKIFDYTI